MIKFRIAAAAAVVAFAAAGCSASVSVGDQSASVETLEAAVTSYLEDMGQPTPDMVSCPEALAPDAGSVVECEVSAGEDNAVVSITSTGLEGDQIGMEMVVTPVD